MNTERVVTTPKRFNRAAVALGSVSLAAGAVFSACGGGGSADNPTQTDTEPSPSNTLVLTATPFETPELTAIPTAIPSPEPTPNNAEIYDLLERALATLTPKNDSELIDIETARSSVKHGLDKTGNVPEKEILSPLNAIGTGASKLTNFACADPNNELIGQAWLELRKFSEYYIEKYIERPASGFFSFYFGVPQGCQNPFLLNN